MLFFFFLQWLCPDLCSTQDLRKQVAPLLKSFQGEVSTRACSLSSCHCLLLVLATFLTTVTKSLTKAM